MAQISADEHDSAGHSRCANRISESSQVSIKAYVISFREVGDPTNALLFVCGADIERVQLIIAGCVALEHALAAGPDDEDVVPRRARPPVIGVTVNRAANIGRIEFA